MRVNPVARLLLSAAGASLWLGACTNPAAERQRVDLEARIIQCEAARWAGPDRFLARLFADSSQAPEVRVRAALAMGRIGAPEFVPVLRTGLAEATVELRAASLFGLGEILDAENASLHRYEPDRAVIDAIRERLLRDPSALVRARAVEALGKTGQRRWLEDLPRLAPKPSDLSETPPREYAEEWAKAALRTGHPGCGPGLVALLGSPVRLAAAKVLVRLIARQAVPAEVPPAILAGLVRDPDPEVRAAAVRLGGFCQPPLSDGEAIRMLQDADHGVRVNALQTLGRRKTGAAVGALIAYVEAGLPRVDSGGEADFLPQELPVAVAALGATGSPQALAALRRWLPHSALLAPHCLQALVAAHADEPLPALAEAPPLRTQARVMRWIQAVAGSTRPEAGAFLRDLEAGRLPPGWRPEWVRAARPFYVSALLKEPAGDGAPGPDDFLADTDPFVRAAALDWLREQTSPDPARYEAVCRAVAAFPSPEAADPQVSAIPLLAKAGPQGVELLKGLRRSRFFQVRLMAARALSEAGIQDAYRGIAPMPTSDLRMYKNFVQRWRYSCLVTMETTRGPVALRLFRREAPLTCANFLKLAGERFYDGIRFHRVVPDFVVQGGCPLGSGNGGPGYAIPCEINTRPYTRGMVGMALSGKDSGGSQFFFTLSRQPHLDGGYTVFAEVVAGMGIVDRLTEEDAIRTIEIWWDIPWEEREIHRF